MNFFKKHRKAISIGFFSLLIGYFMTYGDAGENVWHDLVSENDPAFSISVPGALEHTVVENTAHFSTDYNEQTFALNITRLSEEGLSQSSEEIFQSQLNQLLSSRSAMPISFTSGTTTADFIIVSLDGGDNLHGRMTRAKEFLFLTLVVSDEEHFSEEDYVKFIESLTL